MVFFEKDVPYYSSHRDLVEIPGMDLILYSNWNDIGAMAKRHLSDADAGMVTSYCPDAVVASHLVLSSNAKLKTFYDLDTPVTLDCLKSGRKIDYIPPAGFVDFDLVLSYTGGVALEELKTRLGARRVVPLYGSVDPETHYPLAPGEVYKGDLSFIGTYAEDRQAALNRLFIEAARQLPQQRFVIAGAMYPQEFPWTDNIYFVRHLPPQEHPAFYCSSRITLNVTRRAMAEMGFCPSGRLFEAAACGTPLLTDWWEGLDQFFEPGSEIIVAHGTDDTLDALELSSAELSKIALAARERVLSEHTADHRVKNLEAALQFASRSVADTQLMEA